MESVSSNLTLFYKIFVPVFWTIFFGAFSAALLLSPEEKGGISGAWPQKLAIGGIFLSGLVFLFFTLMRLKRVEIGDGFVYVTNYFQSYRYPLHNIERVETVRSVLIPFGRIYLRVPGRFGRAVLFVPAMGRLKAVIEQTPELKAIWSAS